MPALLIIKADKEQAIKIRYVLANDINLFNYLSENSTLEFENFMVLPLYNQITTNTVWDKPAATLRVSVEDDATFTTESRIDFAPGEYYNADSAVKFKLVKIQRIRKVTEALFLVTFVTPPNLIG